jgi:hypothetical protein
MTDPKPAPRPVTVAAVRADIDRGLTGDKVPGSDPAAAPLGTDAEAGGAPPTAAEIAMEAESRTLRPPPQREGVPHPGWFWAGGVLLVLLVVVAVFGLD